MKSLDEFDGYSCDCFDGYSTDENRCIDIDECDSEEKVNKIS